jgi:hypothetical protein
VQSWKHLLISRGSQGDKQLHLLSFERALTAHPFRQAWLVLELLLLVILLLHRRLGHGSWLELGISCSDADVPVQSITMLNIRH